MKQISMESLRVELGIRIDKSHFLNIIAAWKISTT
jgi:hypothetical protein